MTIVWPEAIAKLREQQAHWQRRLARMEAVAMEGERVDHEQFPLSRALVEGMVAAYDEVFSILSWRPQGAPPFDWAVVLLAQNGLDPEAIASRCGVTIHEVAESLARWAAAAADPKGDE
jgi:hypothetical protein